MRAAAVSVYAPKYGSLRLVVTRNAQGNYEYIVTNDPGADLTSVVERKMSRWQVETLFRDTKQSMRDCRRANGGWIKRWFVTSALFCSPSLYCR